MENMGNIALKKQHCLCEAPFGKENLSKLLLTLLSLKGKQVQMRINEQIIETFIWVVFRQVWRSHEAFAHILLIYQRNIRRP